MGKVYITLLKKAIFGLSSPQSHPHLYATFLTSVKISLLFNSPATCHHSTVLSLNYSLSFFFSFSFAFFFCSILHSPRGICICVANTLVLFTWFVQAWHELFNCKLLSHLYFPEIIHSRMTGKYSSWNDRIWYDEITIHMLIGRLLIEIWSPLRIHKSKCCKVYPLDRLFING